MGKRMTVIPAVRKHGRSVERAKLRVCAYARVSTNHESQEASCEVQINHYMQKIQSNQLWEFAGIYADIGITGTKIKRRDEFKTMLEECEKGNIDLILTKSISRFCRNVVDCLQTVRKLKTLGVGVWFEKENINTLTDNSELVLSILAAIAQAESEDFGSNNRWSILRRFQDGTYTISAPAFGYQNDEDGDLILKEDETEIVKWMFSSYLNGIGCYQIAKQLNEFGIPPIRHGREWTEPVVRGILKNPIYEGDLLLQKTYRDFALPCSHKMNKGEVEQYLITDNHEPLISREEAQAVRYLFDYRKEVLNSAGEQSQNRYVLSGKIICDECGGHFKRKILYGGKKIVWSCGQHIKDKTVCRMKAIDEADIHNAFVTMWNKLYTNKGEVLEPFLESLLSIPAGVDSSEIEKLDKEIETIVEQCRILSQVMKQGYVDTALFMEKYSQQLQKLTNCRRRRNMLVKKTRMRNEVVKTEELIKLLDHENHILAEFDEDIFEQVVREIRVSIEHEITFCLYNGLKLTEVCSKKRR